MIFNAILIILALCLTGLLIFVFTGEKLPPGTNALIREVRTEPLPELMPGTIGRVDNKGVSIGYESIGKRPGPQGSILLITGHSQVLLDWPAYFYQPLVEAGYRVVRYDNRGTGSSDWLPRWDKKTPYTLEDMASDGIAVLDDLRIEKAHIIGASMGGMIGQRLAISYPKRVASLTSIMSTGYYLDPELTGVPPWFYRNFVRYTFRYGFLASQEQYLLKLHLGIVKLLEGNGNYSNDAKAILQKALYEIRNRRGYNRKAGIQHSAAIETSGSRYEELGKIEAPTLVIHGKADTLVKFEHAQKYAPMIPGAKTLFLEGMGHDLPKAYMDKILPAILQNLP